jgi:hypothetical protein
MDYPNCGFLEGGHCTKFHIWNEDEVVCGILGRYFITFVNTFITSKYNSFGGLLAFKQLEVQLCWGFIVNHDGCCWSKRSNSSSLLCAKEHEAFNCIHAIKDLNVGNLCLWNHTILILFFFGWEEWRVTLSRMKREYFKIVKVQWWAPMKKGSNLDEWHLYEDC